MEKQIKTSEDQGKKQIDALKLLEPKKQLVNVNDDDDNEDDDDDEYKLLILKERQIFEDIYKA